jgi:predicted PurR-regulated permease PerM
MKRFTLPDYFFFILLVGFTLAFYKVISFFVIDIILAFILTHLFRKIWETLTNKFNIQVNVASILCIILSLVLIIIPLFVVGILLSNEAASIYFMIKQNWPEIQQSLSTASLADFGTRFSFLEQYSETLKHLELQNELTKVVSTGAELMLNLIQKTFVNVSFMLFHLVVILFLMFFLLVDGKKFIEHVHYLSPINDKDERELFDEIVKISDATLMGTVIIGVLEGVYGGIVFASFGIPSALFWSVVMMIVSMIPIIGINSVLVPTGVIFIATGSVMKGLIIIGLSYAGTTVTQNYLKPYLVGRRGGLHPAIVLLSTLGGITWFGLVGFLIGPMIASLFVSIWNQFGRHYQQELEGWNKGEEV